MKLLSQLGRIFAGLATFAVLVALLVGAFILLSRFGVDDSAVALVAVITSAVIAVRSMESQRRLERERVLIEQRAKLIESYRAVYEKALATTVPSEEEMRTFNANLTFYGDEDLIRAWLGLRRAAAEGADPRRVLSANMNFVRAMRKHLGHSDKTLTDVDLFSVVAKDPDEFARLLSDESREAGRATTSD